MTASRALAEEYSSVELGDPRRRRRLLQVVDKIAMAPDQSFPALAGSDGELEGIYRFLSNKRVTHTKILASHVDATIERARGFPVVRCAHDTSEFRFSGETRRSGLGRLTDADDQGFLGHVAFLVGDGEARAPLGVAGLRHWVRTGPRLGAFRGARRKLNPRTENQRWPALVTEVDERLHGVAEVIHVMDREADSYALLAHMVLAGHRFVVRVAHDRSLDAEGPGLLFEAIAGAPDLVAREVPLGPKPKGKGRRGTRVAKLRIRACSAVLKRPPYADNKTHDGGGLPKTLAVNIVQIYEVDVPAGAESIEWKLVTTEPIETADQVAAIVDHYRARWRIEEFFKALKTGCAFEKRQLESLHALLNALAVFIPVAWRLMHLRTRARETSDGDALHVLTARQLSVLRAASTKRPLPPHPTAHDTMLAVAALGGHIKNNGDPGWMVLGRGFEKVLFGEVIWAAARGEKM